MLTRDCAIIEIKRLKKDGSIHAQPIRQVAEALLRGELVVLPVDNIYAVAGLASPETEKRISRAIGRSKRRYVRIISSFKMLDDLAVYGKADYDFLNRIWPGETTVILRKKTLAPNETIGVRFPRSKFLISIIEAVGSPLIYGYLYRGFGRSPLFRRVDILKGFKESVGLMLIIDELCKKHPLPSLIDISTHDLRIVREGKVPAEEIKSLFFLSEDETE